MKRIFPLALITLGILLSIAALSQLYFGNQSTVPPSNDLPKQVAGVNLTNSKFGKDAIAEFTSLHNEEFPVTSGAVGVYGNGAITLWIAVTSSDSIAAQLVSDMESKINQGNSPFTPVKEIQAKNRNVYVLEG